MELFSHLICVQPVLKTNHIPIYLLTFFPLQLLLSQLENHFPKGINYTIPFFTAQFSGCNENVAESIFQHHFRPQNKFQKLKLELTRKYICDPFFLLPLRTQLVLSTTDKISFPLCFNIILTLAQSQTKWLFPHKTQCRWHFFSPLFLFYRL